MSAAAGVIGRNTLGAGRIYNHELVETSADTHRQHQGEFAKFFSGSPRSDPMHPLSVRSTHEVFFFM